MNPQLGNAYQESLDTILKVVRDSIPFDAPPEDTHLEAINLRECGVTSFQALQIQQALQQELGTQIPLDELLGDASIGELARRHYPQMGSPNPVSHTNGSAAGTKTGSNRAILSPLQKAYWVGRGEEFELGGVGSHWFNEYTLAVEDICRTPSARYLADENPEASASELAVDVLEVAFRQVLAGDVALRSAVTGDGHLEEAIVDCRDFRFDRINLRDLDEAESDRRLQVIRDTHSHIVFDPMRWPMFAITAVLLPEDRVRLLVSTDAVLLDYASFTSLLSRWRDAVTSPFSGPPPVETFRHLDSSPKLASAQRWWQEQALHPAPTLPLSPKDAARTTTRYQRRIDGSTWKRIVQLSESHNVSPTGLLLTVYAVVLDRFRVNDDDFSINLTVYDRPADVIDCLGDYSSNAICDIPRLDFSAPAVTLVERITSRLWECVDNRAYPASSERKRRKSTQNSSLFSAEDPIVFTSTLGVGQADFDSWLGEKHLGLSQTPQVLVDHLVWSSGDDVVLTWDVRDGEWPENMWESFADSSLRAISQFAHEEAWRRPCLGWMPFHEEIQAPVDARVPNDDGLLHTPWLRSARQFPEAPAVIFGNTVLTHAQLNERVQSLINELAGNVRTGDRVIIALPKSPAQVVAALAVCASGAAYVPVDPSWPAARIEAVARRATPSAIITLSGESGSVAALAREQHLPWLSLRHDGSLEEKANVAGNAEPSAGSEVRDPQPDDLAYIIFTSGSTGEPKGVAIEHQQARVTIDDVNERFAVSSADSVLGVSALSFDLSVYDIFGVLGVGGCLVLPDPSLAIDPTYLAGLIDQHEITLWNSAPATFELVIDALETAPQAPSIRSLRDVLLSGDWLPIKLPHRLWDLSPDTRIHSLGGATEAAIWSITYPITRVDPKWKSIPYGRALRGQEFLILDDDGLPCRIGQPGELHIGGQGVARGYLADEEKTNDRFITHPILKRRLYRTGDVGMWRADSTIEFLGRNDRQVKINGFRIELGDVEAALQRMPGVRGAVVTAAKGPDGRQRLVAYLASHDQAQPMEYHRQLKELLPSYMVPNRIITMEALPLTANGKVDFSALPDPFALHTESAATAAARPDRDGSAELADTVESAEESVANEEPDTAPHHAGPQRRSEGDWPIDPAVGQRVAPKNHATAPDKNTDPSPSLTEALHDFFAERTDQDNWMELPLLSLGFDSVSLVQLALLIQEHTGQRPALTSLADAPSAGALLKEFAGTAIPRQAAAPVCEPTQSSDTPPHEGPAQQQHASAQDPGGSERFAPQCAADERTVVTSPQAHPKGEMLSTRLHRIADVLAELEALIPVVDKIESVLGLPASGKCETPPIMAATADASRCYPDATLAVGTSGPAGDDLVASPALASCDAGEERQFNEMQLAYFIGRQTPFFGATTAAHYYTEIAVERLSVTRLKAACARAVELFDCLKLKATPNATGVEQHAPEIAVDSLDLRDLDPSEKSARLSEIREQREARVISLETAPMIGILAARIEDEQWRLCLDLDLLFFDAPTALRISQVIEKEYLQPGSTRNMDRVPLPPLRQVVRQAQRSAVLPPSPALPLTPIAQAAEPTDPNHPAGPKHVWQRMRWEISASEAARLLDDAKKQSSSVTQLILWSAARALSPHRDCSLILTTNPSAIARPNTIGGELTHTAVITVPLSRGEDEARATLRKQYWASMDARINAEGEAEHGNDQLRAARNAGSSMPTVSVSSALGSTPGDASQLLEALGETVYAISQTPGMLLDIQAFRTDDQGSLAINWDFDATIVDSVELRQRFQQFIDLLVPQNESLAETTTNPASGKADDPKHLRALISATFADISRVDTVDPRRPFFEQSITSLDLVAAQRQLHEAGLNLTVVDLLTNPTVDGLVAKLLSTRASTEDGHSKTTPSPNLSTDNTVAKASELPTVHDGQPRQHSHRRPSPQGPSARTRRGQQRASILAQYRDF